jgi:hypothetical protein
MKRTRANRALLFRIDVLVTSTCYTIQNADRWSTVEVRVSVIIAAMVFIVWPRMKSTCSFSVME